MSSTYPVFVEGQTLTESELNLLRSFLDKQDHQLGRMVGFGINCGLDVEIDGGEFVVSPGLAVDQQGRPLVIEEEMRLPIDSVRSEFDWLTPENGRQTLVLMISETLEESPDCEEDGCRRHASTGRRTPVLALADGCLPPGSFTVEGSELAGVGPMTVSRRSKTSNTGAQLAAALARVLRNRGFSAERIAVIADARIDTKDLPGAGAWKAAFLNQLYFASLEMLRCEALVSISCDRSTTTPGVALGCNNGGTWECSRRHHWEPPVGLSTSLLGLGCEDPCRLHRLRIESIIDAFVLPAFPEPDQPPKPGGGGPYRVCKRAPTKGYVDVNHLLTYNKYFCHQWTVPPSVIVDFAPKFDLDDEIRLDLKTDVLEIGEVYGGYHDPLGVGTIGLGTALGADPNEVLTSITTAVLASEGPGFPLDVQIVNADDVGDLEGYEPSLDAAITDTIVLAQDGQGKVVATGRVPVDRTLNTVGPAVRSVEQTAQAAAVDAGTAMARALVVESELTATAGSLDAVAATVQGHQQLLIGEDGAGLVKTVDTLSTRIDTFGNAVSSDMLETRVALAEERFDSELARFDSSIQERISKGQVEIRGELGTQWERNSQRIDEVLVKGRFDQGLVPGGLLRTELVDTLKVMSEAIAGADGTGDESVRAIRDVELRIGRMEAALEAGTDAEGVAGREVVGALEALATATEAMGASRSTVNAIRRNVGRLREVYGQ